MELNYKVEFHLLLGFIVMYTILAMIMSLIFDVLLGNILFFTCFSLPLYLVFRSILMYLRSDYKN